MFMADDRQAHWLNPQTALNYARAAVQVGLWASERILINQTFPNKSAKILELGCGGGRVGLGLAKEGYNNLTVTDFSPVMVDITRGVFTEAGMAQSATIEIANAYRLAYADRSWDGVVFAFNGLMCLRGRADRLEALAEIYRVLKPGGKFLFTANDREKGEHSDLWKNEAVLPGCQNGDRWHETDSTPVFMHSSTESETRQELVNAGFKIIQNPLRSEVALENSSVKNFAGETRFYIAERR
jgi:ubiquinone/menaquinone biosynthesis C-methylase UbiE